MNKNMIELATKLQPKLDKKITVGLLTGWMDKNASAIDYTGGKEVKLPVLETTGLGNYNAEDFSGGAFPQGGVSSRYQTFTMDHDRATKFNLDSMQVDESGFIATAPNIIGEFQEQHVIPEIDAVRLSKVYKYAKDSGRVTEGYAVDPVTILTELKTAIRKIRQTGVNSPLICHITYDAKFALEQNLTTKLSDTTFSVNGIDTRVPSVDGVPLLETPENRMFTEIELLDGKSAGQLAGGYKPSEGCDQIHFIISTLDAPMAITKQDKLRIFDPATNQHHDGYSIDYRRYSGCWVTEGKIQGIYACSGPIAGAVAKKK